MARIVGGFANTIALIVLLILLVVFIALNIRGTVIATETNNSLKALLTITEKNQIILNELLVGLRNRENKAEIVNQEENTLYYIPPKNPANPQPCCGCEPKTE